jgi:hypothetical protein
MKVGGLAGNVSSQVRGMQVDPQGIQGGVVRNVTQVNEYTESVHLLDQFLSEGSSVRSGNEY